DPRAHRRDQEDDRRLRRGALAAARVLWHDSAADVALVEVTEPGWVGQTWRQFRLLAATATDADAARRRGRLAADFDAILAHDDELGEAVPVTPPRRRTSGSSRPCGSWSPSSGCGAPRCSTR